MVHTTSALTEGRTWRCASLSIKKSAGGEYTAEITDEQWATAFRPARVMLDAKLIGWFKEHAGDKPYQTEINRVLRQHVAKAEKKRA